MPTEKELKEESRLRIERIATLQEEMYKTVSELNNHVKDQNGRVNKNDSRLYSVEHTLYGQGDSKGLCQRIDLLFTRQWKLIVCVAILSASIGTGSAEIVRWVVG